MSCKYWGENSGFSLKTSIMGYVTGMEAISYVLYFIVFSAH